MEKNLNYDKIVGMLTGLAIGDALGAPFEFRNVEPKSTYDGILKDVNHTIKFRFSSTTLVASSITDDTEMTLTLLKSILEKGMYDKNHTILMYLDWAQKSKFMGKNTRALFKNIKTIKGYEKRKSQIDMSYAQSNGSLMRASPLALLKNYKEAIIEDTSITNENNVNIECSLLYVDLLRFLLFGKKFTCKITEESIRSVLKSALNRDILDIGGKKKGWVVYAIYVVFITLFNCSSFQDAMDFIMKNFPTSDTDTIMCITGAVFGAFVGIENMCLEHKTSINIKKINDYLSKQENYNLPNIIKNFF